MAIPIGWEALLLLRAHRFAPGQRLATATAFAAAIAPVVGFGLFVVGSEIATGLSPFDADRQHWGYANAAPWDVLGYAWNWMLDPATAGFADIQALTGFHLVLLALFTGLFLVGLRRLPLTYSWYVGPQLLVIMMGGPTTPLQSASRFMLAMFPIFVVLAQLGRNPRFHTAWLVASVLGLGLLFTAILLNVPVG